MPVESHNIEHNGYPEKNRLKHSTLHPTVYSTAARTAQSKPMHLIRNHDAVLGEWNIYQNVD